jgi:hypothetical protein
LQIQQKNCRGCLEDVLEATGVVEPGSPERGPVVRGMVLKARLLLLCRMVTFREPPAPHIYSRNRGRASIIWALMVGQPQH